MKKILSILIISSLLFSGCSHSDMVEDLILENYPQLKEGGAIIFETYREKKNTEWNVREFTAEGIVKWEQEWFVVEREYEGRGDIADVVIISACDVLNKGIPFQAVFYKGRTEKRASVKLDIGVPGNKFMTEESLLKRYSDKHILLPSGKCIGLKINKDNYGKARDREIIAIKDFVSNAAEVIVAITSRVDKVLAVKYKSLNDDDLSSHSDECERMAGRFDCLHMISELKDAASYFAEFPIADMGQDSVIETLAELEKKESELLSLKKMIDKRILAARTEKSYRTRRGIKFLPQANVDRKSRSQTETLALNGNPVPVSDVPSTRKMTKLDERKPRRRKRREDDFSTIVMPSSSKHNAAPKEEPLIIPAAKPIIIKMPK